MRVYPLSMPREDEHATRSKRNEEFAESLDLTDPIRENWAVVAAFYSALHYVEAFFVKHGTPCHRHEDRNEQFKGDKRIRASYANYQYLYTLSRTARYQCVGLPDKAYSKDAKAHLAAVKRQIDHARKLAAKA